MVYIFLSTDSQILYLRYLLFLSVPQIPFTVLQDAYKLPQNFLFFSVFRMHIITSHEKSVHVEFFIFFLKITRNTFLFIPH